MSNTFQLGIGGSGVNPDGLRSSDAFGQRARFEASTQRFDTGSGALPLR